MCTADSTSAAPARARLLLGEGVREDSIIGQMCTAFAPDDFSGIAQLAGLGTLIGQFHFPRWEYRSVKQPVCSHEQGAHI